MQRMYHTRHVHRQGPTNQLKRSCASSALDGCFSESVCPGCGRQCIWTSQPMNWSISMWGLWPCLKACTVLQGFSAPTKMAASPYRSARTHAGRDECCTRPNGINNASGNAGVKRSTASSKGELSTSDRLPMQDIASLHRNAD